MNSSARLLVQIGAQPERSYPIERDITILGRETINDMVVNDAEVSRRHSRIVREADGYLVEDLGSTNGTFVNGKRVTVPTLLYHGDIIDMGKSAHLIFKLDQPHEQMTRPIQMDQPVSSAQDIIPPHPSENMEPGMSPYAPRYDQADAAPQAPDSPQYEDELFEEYEEADSAEFYRPPASSINSAADSQNAEAAQDSSPGQRYLMTFGCLTVLIVVLLLAVLLILDQVAPEFLYCGSLESFWQTVLSPVLKFSGKVWNCQ